MSKVTVLGLGLMGTAIARALAGPSMSDLVVWNRTAAKSDALRALGASVAPTAGEAVAAAPLSVSVLTDATAFMEALGDDIDLTGHAVVNLATGTPQQANDLDEWVRARGGRFMSGTIASYPKDIGTAQGAVVFSGEQGIWEQFGDTLMRLGPGSKHVGPVVSDASTLDLSMLIYYMVATAAWQEALAFASGNGVTPERLLDWASPTFDILSRENRLAVSEIADSRFETDQATIETFRLCMDLVGDSMTEVKQRGRLSAAAGETYTAAAQTHLETLAVPALFAMLKNGG